MGAEVKDKSGTERLGGGGGQRGTAGIPESKRNRKAAIVCPVQSSAPTEPPRTIHALCLKELRRRRRRGGWGAGKKLKKKGHNQGEGERERG